MKLKNNKILELKKLIDEALNELYHKDISLIERKVNERSIVFRFCLYLDSLLKKTKWEDLNIDCEYNRNDKDIKDTKRLERGTYPDVIIHKREYNTENLLVLEFKGWWNNKKKHEKNDYIKLEDFTSQGKKDYKYALGAFIKLNKEREKVEICYFINGEQEELI